MILIAGSSTSLFKKSSLINHNSSSLSSIFMIHLVRPTLTVMKKLLLYGLVLISSFPQLFPLMPFNTWPKLDLKIGKVKRSSETKKIISSCIVALLKNVALWLVAPRRKYSEVNKRKTIYENL